MMAVRKHINISIKSINIITRSIAITSPRESGSGIGNPSFGHPSKFYSSRLFYFCLSHEIIISILSVCAEVVAQPPLYLPALRATFFQKKAFRGVDSRRIFSQSASPALSAKNMRRSRYMSSPFLKEGGRQAGR